MSGRKVMTEAYEKALALPRKSEARKAALDRAHEMRKFEIENYWKRATYFWSFQAIAFAVLGFILKDVPDNVQIMQLPAAIGAVSGFVGWLSAKGSKFWQENWEAHVDMLESEIEGHLTQLIWSDGRISHSVSRLNQAFMGTLTASWIAVMAIASSREIPEFIAELSPWWLFTLLAIVLIVIYLWTRQNMTGHVLHGDSWIQLHSDWRWSWIKNGVGNETRQLLLRHTKAKDAVSPDE